MPSRTEPSRPLRRLFHGDKTMRFKIKVDGRVLLGIYPSTQAAYESTADQHPEARSIGVFCLRGKQV